MVEAPKGTSPRSLPSCAGRLEVRRVLKPIFVVKPEPRESRAFAHHAKSVSETSYVLFLHLPPVFAYCVPLACGYSRPAECLLQGGCSLTILEDSRDVAEYSLVLDFELRNWKSCWYRDH